MQIRKAKTTDADQISRVDTEAFTNSPWGDAHNMRNDKSLQQQRLNDNINFCYDYPGQTFVAVEDDKIVGFVMIGFNDACNAGRIRNTAVLPAYTNRGISTTLVKQAIKELKNLGARYICVNTALVPAARRVYEKAGFTLAKRKENMYYYEIHITTPPA